MMYSDFNKLGLFSISLLLIAGITPQLSAQIQEEFLPQAQTFREMTLRIDVLEASFRESESALSIEQLQSIREHCETLLPRMSPSDRKEAQNLIHRTLLLQAVIHYYNGELNQAETLANDLLRQEPAALLTGNLATPEVAEWFETIREKYTGFITINSTPTGSVVIMDGTTFGVTPLENAFAPVGEHLFEILHDGCETHRETVTIVNQETQFIHAILARNSGGLFIWVSPPDTTISINTMPRPIRTEPVKPSFLFLLQCMGFDPFSFSQPVYIGLVPPGENTIRLAKECRQTISYTFTMERADYYLPLLVLPPSITHLSVNSDPDRQHVFIDDSYIGDTPIIESVVCPGERTVRVEFPDGREWQRVLTLKPDEVTEIQAIPRPTVLFLGGFSADRGLAIEGDRTLASWLDSIGNMNIIHGDRARRYRLRPVVASVIESLASTTFDPDNIEWQRKVEDMVASLSDVSASVIAFARLEEAASRDSGRLFFMHKDSSNPDVLPLPSGLPSMTALHTLDPVIRFMPPRTRLRSGIRVTDTGRQVVISQIIPGGPAETSPLQAGDVILSLNGQSIMNGKEFNRMLADPESPETMPFSAIRSDRQITGTIEMIRQPMVPALSDSRILYNLVLAFLEHELLQSGSTSTPALIQTGVCCLAIGRPDRARDYFNQCQLTDRKGFGSATLSYLKYLSDVGLRIDPNVNLKAAMESPEATIIHGDGPALSDLLK